MLERRMRRQRPYHNNFSERSVVEVDGYLAHCFYFREVGKDEGVGNISSEDY